MAFTVEDGTGVADANAYITVAYFRAWHVDRGLSAASANSGSFTDALIQAGIIKATDYVDKRFGPIFKGYKEDRDNSLEWPRNSVVIHGYTVDSDTIPVNLKRAVAEYALLAMYLNELLPLPANTFNTVDPTTGETTVSEQGMLTRHREKVGPIEEENWFNPEQWRLLLNARAPGVFSSITSSYNLPEYPVADEWMKHLITTGGSISLSRA